MPPPDSHRDLNELLHYSAQLRRQAASLLEQIKRLDMLIAHTQGISHGVALPDETYAEALAKVAGTDLPGDQELQRQLREAKERERATIAKN